MIEINTASRAFERPRSAVAADWTHDRTLISQLSQSVNRLAKQVGEQGTTSAAADFVRIAKAARWEVNTTLSSPARWEYALENTVSLLENILRKVSGSIDQSLESTMRNITHVISEIRNEPETSLLTVIQSPDRRALIARSVFVTLGRKEKMLTQGGLEYLNLDNKVLSLSEVTRLNSVESAILIGSPVWFEEPVIACGRFARATFLHYANMPSKNRFYGVFGSGATVGLLVRSSDETESKEHRAAENSIVTSISAMQPIHDWRALRTAATPERDDDDGRVPARLARLEGSYTAWLESESRKRLRRLHPERSQSERLELCRTSELECGDYLLLRAGGVSPEQYRRLVDLELGLEAAGIRRRQHAWKSGLRKHIDRYGANSVVNSLKNLGAKTSNIGYWAGNESIRPRSDTDFRVLLHFLGIEHVEQTLTEGRQLWKLHQRIGTRLTDVAEQEASAADMDILKQRGFIQIAVTKDDVRAQFIVAQLLELDSHVQQIPAACAHRAIYVRE